MSIEAYEEQTPKLKPEEYFDGHVKAWGIFENRNGEVTREFTGDFHGEWDGDTLTIDESLNYKDGETERRTWHFRKTDDHHYDVSGDNLVGPAKGQAMGNALNLQYTISVDVDGSTWNLSADDWMYRQDETTVLNRAHLTWWGFTAGELTIVYRKVE